MSKKQKKRTKRYQGENAKQTASREPAIHRYEAVQRTKLGEWWHPRKQMFKIGAIVTGAVGLLVWLISELLRIVF